MRLARAAAPAECVGFLAGREAFAATALFPLRNVAESPERRYLADPGGVARALKAIDADGLVLVAIYHSHPRGGAEPSRADLAGAAWDVPYLIVDGVTGRMRAWRLLGGAREVPLEVAG